ncbi:hypothetical protein KDY119_00433 [Luteimicrobium xylanilyticum]|uniref:Helicase XPB/Ssl2 N-terminal domain-containing protein n=1 Tax=Luteimicrobium xylanilyticum TaxID=1133546 RepID=A0A5P9Q6C9_9MICO|nr:helicase-associated domain-containing protein [Luteimicrobium xylanilyticum]QFU96941.1 hypothetical protein KDY119_00433 [Luteimicrobium xylanilyticum]
MPPLSARDELVAHLRTLSPDALAALLDARSDLLGGAAVRDLDELADRVTHPASVSEVLTHAPTPLVQILQVLSALGAGATTDRAAELVGAQTPDARAAVEAAVDGLVDLAIVWPVAGDPGRWRVNPGVDALLVSPLGLGAPSRVLLADLTVARLQKLVGKDVRKVKADLLDAAERRFADPAQVRRVLADAPAGVFESLVDAVTRTAGPAADDDPDDDPMAYFPSYVSDPAAARRHGQAARWAADAGLAVEQETWGYGFSTVALPAEVSLALQPPGYRAPFDPEPPPVPTAAVAPVQVRGAASAALTAFLAVVVAVLESASRRPFAVLRSSGGIGARELGRVAKALKVEPVEVRFALELAAPLRLLDRVADGLTVSDAFSRWRARSLQDRAADLLLTWLQLPYEPSVDRLDDGGVRPVLLAAGSAAVVDARSATLAALAAFPDDVALVSADDVAARLAWQAPLVGDVEGRVRTVLREAERVGVVALGALAPIGRAWFTDERAWRDAVADAIPDEQRTVLFGSDLTAVVTGSPAPDVVDLLDDIGTRESHGTASTWRFTEVSLRDALDRGYGVEGMLVRLRALSDKPLPQPLEYLLRDLGRRYGRLRIGAARTVLTSDDETLVAEVAAHRSLARLGLRLVAPTVLVGSAEPAPVLAALRKAGYLPMEVDDDGEQVLRLARVPAAPDVPEEVDAELATITDEAVRALLGTHHAAGRTAELPGDAARRLLAGDAPVDTDEVAATTDRIVLAAPRITRAEARQLAHAVVHGTEVVIRYRASSGGVTLRTVSDLEVVGNSLYGYCHLRHDDRNFNLAGVLEVRAP